ncbi:hypothetical protein [Nocardia terrae]|uniref:hypothetical protein n=1 Tax=Nocardia terrae TaxID=2675851 RepID=UPI001F16D4D3|nr:hypothetical protein [Nocardia terrae]
MGSFLGFAADGALAGLVWFWRAGFVRVTSVGPKDNTSFEPVGFTCRKSPSDGSPRDITFPDRPSGTPTAAAVNHTIGGRPASISAAICRISVSDKGCGLVRVDMGHSGRTGGHLRAKSMHHGTDKSTSGEDPMPLPRRSVNL